MIKAIDDDKTGSDEHHWASSNMPWFINGTLSEADAQQLQAHLRTCKQCREEVQTEKQLLEQLAARPGTEYTPHASFKALQQRIEGDTRRQRRWTWLKWRPAFLAENRNWLANLTIGAQAAAIAALAVTLFWFVQDSMPTRGYATLTSSPQNQAAQQAVVQLVFAKNVTTGEMKVILEEIDGRIIDGPSHAGMFEVELSSSTNTELTVEQAIERLKANSAIVFVTQKSVTGLSK